MAGIRRVLRGSGGGETGVGRLVEAGAGVWDEELRTAVCDCLSNLGEDGREREWRLERGAGGFGGADSSCLTTYYHN